MTRDRRVSLLSVLATLASMGLLASSYIGVPPGHPVQFMLFGIIGVLVLWSIVVESFLVHVLDGVRETERKYRGIEGRCLHCGYLLRGLISGMCPECGRGARREETNPPSDGGKTPAPENLAAKDEG